MVVEIEVAVAETLIEETTAAVAPDVVAAAAATKHSAAGPIRVHRCHEPLVFSRIIV